MRKIASKSYYILLAIGLVFIFLTNISSGVDIYEKYEKNSGTAITPTEEISVSEKVKKYIFTEGFSEQNTTLLFFSRHQCVHVYADGELIYAVEQKNTIWGKTTGKYINFVSIPGNTEKIEVVIQAIYPQMYDAEMSFFTGDAQVMYQRTIESSLIAVLISIVDVLVGIFMFIYWTVSRRQENGQKTLLYLSIFAFTLGMWSLNETPFMILILRNRVGCSFSSYLFLMMMTIPYLYFTISFLQLKRRRVTDILAGSYCFAFFVITVLHMIGICEFKQSVYVIHGAIVIEFIYCFIAIFQRKRKQGFDRRCAVSMFGSLAFFAVFVIDMTAYYVGRHSTDLFARIALLVYIILLGYEILLETLKRTKEIQKTEIYRELAMKDSMTGLYNRNAYNQWLDQHGSDQNVAILMCDLNDLKKCNDTKGHAVGDSYIMGAADIISRVFEHEGVCYRIGGDEFCVILKNAKEIDLADKVRELNEMEEECNRMIAEMRINIAYGYAVFDKELDKNVEDTCKRADKEMYRNKQKRKETDRK